MQVAKGSRQPFCRNDIHALSAPPRPPIPQTQRRTLRQSPSRHGRRCSKQVGNAVRHQFLEAFEDSQGVGCLFLPVRVFKPDENRAAPSLRSTTREKGATGTARRTAFFPSDAISAITRLPRYRNPRQTHQISTDFCRRTTSPAIAHAGDRGSASRRVALPKPSRVEELPISA